MKKEQTRLQVDLLKTIGKFKTHPGIKTAIIQLINNEWKQNTDKKINSNDEQHILNVVQYQNMLGHQALKK